MNTFKLQFGSPVNSGFASFNHVANNQLVCSFLVLLLAMVFSSVTLASTTTCDSLNPLLPGMTYGEVNVPAGESCVVDNTAGGLITIDGNLFPEVENLQDSKI